VPVAVLAPVEPASTQSPKEVIASIKALREGRSLGDLSIRDLIAEGRA
jgi:hypothetical protein